MAVGSHTIPRFYLEQFAVQARRKVRAGKVWTYEKGKPPQQRATDSQGYENGYFASVRANGKIDESFETKLANLEGRYNDALVCAKSELYDLSLAHKNEVGFYVGMLFARSTSRKKFSAGNWAKLQGPFAQLEHNEDYVRDTAAHFSEVIGTLISPEMIRGMIRNQAAAFTQKELIGNAFIEDLLFHAGTLKAELLQKPWQVWFAPSDKEFVTSDSPVITFLRVTEDLWHPGHGFRKPDVVIAFPLAPTACLAAGIEGPEHRKVDAGTVRRMNEMIVRCCDRFVYSKTFNAEISAMVDSFAQRNADTHERHTEKINQTTKHCQPDNEIAVSERQARPLRQRLPGL